MKKCKRFLAVLLAMLLIGGAVSAAASAAAAGSVPVNANAFAFAMQTVVSQEGEGEEGEPEEIELTDEQAYELMVLMMPVLLIGKHGSTWGPLPNFLKFKLGKNADMYYEEYMGYIEDLFEENGLDREVTFVDLYLDGVLGVYANGAANAYEKAIGNNCNFLATWSWSIMKWFYLSLLPESTALLMLLPYIGLL